MSVNTLEQVEPLAESKSHTWTLADRCCADKGTRGYQGAVVVAEQAYHRWTKGDKELFFCNHHNKQVEDKLFLEGWNVEHHPEHDQLDKPIDINFIDE